MPGWDDASVDELLADPIVRELMAADGVDLGELRTLLHEVQRTIERYATKRGGPSSLVGFAQLHGAMPRSTPRSTPTPTFSPDPAQPTIPRANRDQSDVGKTRTDLPDRSRLSIAPLRSVFCG
jgi:hypothetical protein